MKLIQVITEYDESYNLVILNNNQSWNIKSWVDLNLPTSNLGMINKSIQIANPDLFSRLPLYPNMNDVDNLIESGKFIIVIEKELKQTHWIVDIDHEDFTYLKSAILREEKLNKIGL